MTVLKFIAYRFISANFLTSKFIKVVFKIIVMNKSCYFHNNPKANGKFLSGFRQGNHSDVNF